jgi:hypothetical protein
MTTSLPIAIRRCRWDDDLATARRFVDPAGGMTTWLPLGDLSLPLG